MNVIYAKLLDERMPPDIQWLIGRSIVAFGKQDYTWFCTLDDNSTITTESPWRLTGPKGVLVTSEDHGQQFGLPAPVDAAEAVKKEVGARRITRCEIEPRTGDLALTFEDDIMLSFFCLSSGYEAWHMTHGDHEIICLGGGRLAEVGGK